MKQILIAAGLAFLLLGCDSAGGGGSEDIAALKKDVAELKRSNADLRLKSLLVSGMIGRSPLENFFAEPEFWENTYDSGEADCARRCQRENKPLREACAAKPESERQQCYTDASNSLAQCVQRCS